MDDIFVILIEDNGCGIELVYMLYFYDKGFMVNKIGGIGYGLYLVK